MKELFYLFQSYLDDPDITDVNYNGRMLWLDHLKKDAIVMIRFVMMRSSSFAFRLPIVSISLLMLPIRF